MATDLLKQVQAGYYGTVRTGVAGTYDMFAYLKQAIGTALGKVEAGTRTLQDFQLEKNIQDLEYYVKLTGGSRPKDVLVYNQLVERYNELLGTSRPTFERDIINGTAILTSSEGDVATSPRTSTTLFQESQIPPIISAKANTTMPGVSTPFSPGLIITIIGAYTLLGGK